MAKDPAFLFYPGDWQGGTMYFDHQTKGAYIDLMILQFNVGKFTEAQAKQVLSICFDVAWPLLKQKFQTDGVLFWNDRLCSEIEKRKKFTESRRNNGLAVKKMTKTDEAYAYHMHKHMEDENRNRNIEDNTVKIKKGQPKKNEVVFPDADNPDMNDSWIDVWGQWTDYKKSQHKETYKTTKTEQVALNNLVALSEGSPAEAEKIVQQSIANLWKGFFKLKNSLNGSGTIQSGTLFNQQPKLGTSAARIEALKRW